MPHKRYRESIKRLNKKLSFQPVVAVQGARQTGKSFLLRELLAKQVKGIQYITFDDNKTRQFAESAPETFLAQYLDFKTLIVDEAQKVPDIFDAVKFAVDNDRRPGMYILAGSTEFSKKVKIRESLTGRMTTLRVFPMTMREAAELAFGNPTEAILPRKHAPSHFSRHNLLKHLQKGGMPGIFGVRGLIEHRELLSDWLDLTVRRDLMMIPGVKLDPNLALDILEALATLDEPTIGHVAKKMKRDPRRIKSHVEGLTLLFVLNRLDPHANSTGQSMYFLCDVSFSKYFEASFERQLQTWVLQESLARREFIQNSQEKFFFFRTSKGGMLHFVFQHSRDSATLVKILATEKFDRNELKILTSAEKKLEYEHTRLLALGAMQADLKKERIEILPWEAFA